MKINRINYEEYIVSSLEGMLSTEEQVELDAFLHNHTELKQEVNIYKLTFLVPDTRITYPNKSLLLKPELSHRNTSSYSRNSSKITGRNYEEYVVKSLEGIITTEEQASLDIFLNEHPELRSEADAYKMAFLVPDKMITYPHKSLLLKQESVRAVIPFYRRYSIWMSVAATVLLLLVFRVFMNNDDFTTRGSNEPVVQSQAAQRDYAFSEQSDLPEQQVQENFVSTNGNPREIRIAANPSNSGHIINRQGSVAIKEVAAIPTKEVDYLPQASAKPRIASLPMSASERAFAVAQQQQAQRSQGTLVSNAALVGKTLWHLSGRQLPNEAETGQQFHVVQVNYNSKDFSFVKIIH